MPKMHNPTDESSANADAIAIIIIGIIVIGCVYFPLIPIRNYGHVSLAQVNTLCSGLLGFIEQNCGFYNALFVITWIIGVVLIIAGIGLSFRSESEQRPKIDPVAYKPKEPPKVIPTVPIVQDRQKYTQKERTGNALYDMNTLKSENPEFYFIKEIKVKNIRPLIRSLQNYLDRTGYEFEYNFIHYGRPHNLNIVTINGAFKAYKHLKIRRQKIVNKYDWKGFTPHLKWPITYTALFGILSMIFGASLAAFYTLGFPNSWIKYPNFPFHNPSQGALLGLSLFVIYLMIPVFLLILFYKIKFQIPKKAIMVEKPSDLKTNIVLQLDGEGYQHENQNFKDYDTIAVDIPSEITIKIAGGITPISYKMDTNYNSKIIKEDIDNLLQKIDEYTMSQ